MRRRQTASVVFVAGGADAPSGLPDQRNPPRRHIGGARRASGPLCLRCTADASLTHLIGGAILNDVVGHGPAAGECFIA